MYCAYCGTEVQEGQKYCSGCGRPAASLTAAQSNASFPGGAPAGAPAAVGPTRAPIPPPFREQRLTQHLQILGIIWIVLCVLRLIPGLGILFFGRLGLPFIPLPARTFVIPILGAVGIFLVVTAVAGIVAGWGLLDRRPWARMLAIVLGCAALIDIPFGTALGIYTLWVLASAGAEPEYRRLAAQHEP